MEIISFLPRQGSPGFYEIEFDSIYTPHVLFYEKKGQDSSPDEPFPNSRGVFILVNTKRQKKSSSFVKVGFSGVSGNSTLFCRLGRLWHDSNKSTSEESVWNKAILICNWQDDIKVWLNNMGNLKTEAETKLIEAVMDSEVFYLEKILFHGLNSASRELNINLVGNKKAIFPKWNTDSPRNKDYLDMVKILLFKIINKSTRSLITPRKNK